MAVYCENTIRCLKEAGCQVTTFGPKGSRSVDHPLPTVHLNRFMPKVDATYCFPNRKLLKEALFGSYDVIHINCPQSLSGALLCIIGKRRKIKVIYYNHGNVAIYCQFNYKWAWYRKLGTRISSALYYFPQLYLNPIIVENPGCSDLRALFKKKCKTIEGACGTNLELFQFSPTHEKYHLISIGRLSPEKNWQRLLTFFSHLPRHYRLTILGAGYGENELKKQCQELSLNNVTFVGAIPQQEVSSYLQKAQAYITASTFETWGLTLTEALACGTPVVYPNHPPFPHLYGRKFPEGQYELEDPASFVKAVIQTEQSNPESRRECRAFAEQFSWENATAKLLEIYKNV